MFLITPSVYSLQSSCRIYFRVLGKLGGTFIMIAILTILYKYYLQVPSKTALLASICQMRYPPHQ